MSSAVPAASPCLRIGGSCLALTFARPLDSDPVKQWPRSSRNKLEDFVGRVSVAWRVSGCGEGLPEDVGSTAAALVLSIGAHFRPSQEGSASANLQRARPDVQNLVSCWCPVRPVLLTPLFNFVIIFKLALSARRQRFWHPLVRDVERLLWRFPVISNISGTTRRTRPGMTTASLRSALAQLAAAVLRDSVALLLLAVAMLSGGRRGPC